MNIKDKMPLIVAVVLGLVGIVIVNRYVERKTTPERVDKVHVLTAARKIEAGGEIAMEDISKRGADGELTASSKAIPQKESLQVHILLPSGRSPAEQRQREQRRLMLVGREVRRTIMPGEPVLWSDLVEEASPTLSRRLRPERRAVTLGVDTLTAVGYNIVPGDHLDILVTLQPQLMAMFGGDLTQVPRDSKQFQEMGGAEGGPRTTMLMQDVVVLATGTRSSSNGSPNTKYGSITVDVTPQEALVLTHARRQGTLSFMLRAPSSTHRLDEKEREGSTVKNSTLRERVGALDVRRAQSLDILHPERDTERRYFRSKDTDGDDQK